MNDGSSTFNWYDVKIRMQTIGGYEAYGSNWRTADTWTHHNLYDPFLNYIQHVVDYDPTTTSGVNTVYVSVGVTAGEEGAQVTSQMGWSYSIKDVRVIDKSDESQELVAWQ